MAIYKAKELAEKISEIVNSGYDFIEVLEIDKDDEEKSSAALSFSAVDISEGCISSDDYGYVDSCEISNENSEDDESSEPFVFCCLTNSELNTVYDAVENTINYCKLFIKNKNYPKDTQDNADRLAIKMRNFKVKLDKLFDD